MMQSPNQSGISVYPDAKSDERPPSPTEEAFDALGNALLEHNQTLAKLHERLGPVLGPVLGPDYGDEPEQPTTGDHEIATSVVVSRAYEAAANVRSCTAQLTRLLQRLEV